MISYLGQLRGVSIVFISCVIAAFFLVSDNAQADSPEAIVVADNYYDLGCHLRYYEDIGGHLSFNDIQFSVPSGRWALDDSCIPSFGYTSSAYWFKLTLENPGPVTLKRVLEVAYPMLDNIDLYIKHQGGRIIHLHSGDHEPFDQRLIKHRHFVFPIEFAEYERLTVYLRLQTSSALQLPVALWNERDFWTSGQKQLGLQGIYFGIMMVMVLYNLFIYASVRDNAYLFYVLFITFFATFQLTFHGLSYQYLWHWDPMFNEKVLMLSVSASIFFLLWFVTKVLKTEDSHVQLHQWIIAIAVLAGCNAIATPLLPYQSSIYVSIVLSVIGCILCLSAGIIRWHDNYTPARYYTIAWLSLLVGTAVFSLSKFGLFPRNFFTENAIQFGSALDAILLSFALADRIKIARKEKDIAQAQAVDMLQRYRLLYENAIEGIFQITPDYRLVSANRAMADMLGFQDPQELLASTINDLKLCFSDTRDAEEFYRRLKERGEVFNYERQCRRSDGSLFWACWTARAVYDNQNQLLRYEGALVDITVRKEKEQAELDREAADASSRAKSQFLATMSHEIRTPMNGMLGMIELLFTTVLNQQQKRYAETARRSGEQLLSVINDILDFSKIEVDKLELEQTEFDLTLLLEDLRSLYQSQVDGKGITLIIDYPPIDDSYLLHGDSLRLRQVLSNLLSNSIKFTEQGSVSLFVINHEETEDHMLLTFIVTDTGIGIEPAAQTYIFEAFSQADGSTTRKYGGTGLGLAICKRLVNLMGGEITLESQLNLGTSFRFTITLKKTLRTEQVETAAAVSRQLSMLPEANPVVTAQTPLEDLDGQRILLVEDNPTNQLLAVSMLENLELEVDVVNNGREAITAFESDNYHIILMDCQMPEMDGFAATEGIRSLEKAQNSETPIPIIALTANAFPSDRERCLAVGMNDYLAKPFTIDQLKQKLEIYLNAKAVAEDSDSATAKIVA